MSSQGYRLYDAANGKIHTSRDVLFHEGSFHRRNKCTIVENRNNEDTVTVKLNDKLLEDNDKHEVNEEMDDSSNNSKIDEQQQPQRSARMHKSSVDMVW